MSRRIFLSTRTRNDVDDNGFRWIAGLVKKYHSGALYRSRIEERRQFVVLLSKSL